MLETNKIVLEASEVTFGPNFTTAKVPGIPRLSESSLYTMYETLFVTIIDGKPKFEVESETWKNEMSSSRILVPSEFIGRRLTSITSFNHEIQSVDFLHDTERQRTTIEIQLY